MKRRLFHSITIKDSDMQISKLKKDLNINDFIFMSLHMQEEYLEIKEYKTEALKLLDFLHSLKLRIIVDITQNTFKYFEVNTVAELINLIGKCYLRFDYGIKESQIFEGKKLAPLICNGTSMLSISHPIYNSCYALHNYYPRTETGISREYLIKYKKAMNDNNVIPMNFIAGKVKRKPVFDGLPTLEEHRYLKEYPAYISSVNLGMEAVFIGDTLIDEMQLKLIRDYENTGVLKLPSILENDMNHIYNKVFTIREDIPDAMFRLIESREFSCTGEDTPIGKITKRNIGSITMDNLNYPRYTGEMHISRKDLPLDERVNVIGQIHEDYLPILEWIKAYDRISFVKVDNYD